jgi:UDP-glucose 4-epimerase
MRVLLTGGAGYVGSACLRWLLRAGHDALVYDDLSTGDRAALAGGRLVVGDILDTAQLARVLREHRSEAVLHFAALAIVPESMREPERYYRINVSGTQSVLDAARSAGVPRVVLSSTGATYAVDAPMPLAEDGAQRPPNVYGRSKLAAEWLVRDYCAAYGVGCGILRYFNAAGADADGEFGEDHTHETRLLPLLFGAALGTRPPLQVSGTDWPTPDGTCVRDFVHVEDLASAHQLLLEALAPSELRVYNVGTGRGESVRAVLAACREISGREIPWQPGPRRPAGAGGRRGAAAARAGLEAALPRHPRDRGHRLGLAPALPAGLSLQAPALSRVTRPGRERGERSQRCAHAPRRSAAKRCMRGARSRTHGGGSARECVSSQRAPRRARGLQCLRSVRRGESADALPRGAVAARRERGARRRGRGAEGGCGAPRSGAEPMLPEIEGTVTPW